MYAVIDTTAIPLIPTRSAADQTLASLREFNKDANWQLFVAVNDEAILEELERLYALTDMLLRAGGVNPLTVGVVVRDPDGTEREFSAVTVMNSAREWLDQVTH